LKKPVSSSVSFNFDFWCYPQVTLKTALQTTGKWNGKNIQTKPESTPSLIILTFFGKNSLKGALIPANKYVRIASRSIREKFELGLPS
jgi:hypothetical protein